MLYNQLNMQAQKAALKALDAHRKIHSTIPNRESGLGRVDGMNRKMKQTSGSNSYLEPGNNVSDYLSRTRGLVNKSPLFQITASQIENTRASFGVSTSATDAK